VASYGVEIWGWREREGMKRIHKRFLRWILEVDGKIHGERIHRDIW